MTARLHVAGEFRCDVDDVDIVGNRCTFKAKRFNSDWARFDWVLEFEDGSKRPFAFQHLSNDNLGAATITGLIA